MLKICKKYQEKEECCYLDLLDGLVVVVLKNWVFVECFVGMVRLVLI